LFVFLIAWVSDCLAAWLVDWLFAGLTDWFIDWLLDCSVVWLIDLLDDVLSYLFAWMAVKIDLVEMFLETCLTEKMFDW
jgi:hypothetical protein